MISRKKQARIAGLLYLMLLPTGIFSLIYVPSTLIVFGDAAATIQNIEASELLYRSGIYVGLLSNLIYLLVALALYRLLKDVSEKQATLMVAFVVLGVAASFANSFNQLAVLVILGKPEFLSAFDSAQLEGVAYLFIRLQSHGNQIIQIFWGLWLIDTAAAATIQNIGASELLYRSGIYVGLLSNLIYLLVALALYRLLKDVSEKQATLMVAFVVLGVAASFANSFNQLAVLVILGKPEFLSAFDSAQLEGVAYLFIRLQSHGNQIIQIFWGLWLIPMGILVYRSGFIPKIIGVSLWFAAFAYLMSNFTFLLLPQYIAALSPIITGLEMLELPIILWLVIVGTRTPPGEAS